MTKRAWIYVRVSSEEQGKGYSLESQESHCRDYAARHDYTVVGVAQDLHSGEALDRAGLGSILDAAAVDPFDVLVVYDMDRFSRGGPVHCAVLEMEFERRGVIIEYVLGNFNGNSPEALLAKYIKQTTSWYENQQRRERSRRGKLTAAKHGRVITGTMTPYGYRYADGQLHIDPQEAEIVHRIFRESVEGISARKIAERLSAERIPTRMDTTDRLPKRNGAGIWHYSTVRKILRNQAYAGTWHFNKRRFSKTEGKLSVTAQPPDQWIAVAIPPLIDEETFERAQAQLDSNRILAKRNTKYEYLLQARVMCACGHRCLCETDKRHNKRFYICQNRRRKAWEFPCTVRFSISADTLESAIWRLVVETLLDPAHLQSWLAAQRTGATDRRRQGEERLAAVVAERREADRKFGVLLDLALTEEFPRAVVDERKKVLVAQQRRLENEELQARAALAALDVSPDQERGLLTLAERMRQSIGALDFAARRKVIEVLNLQVQVTARRTVRISALLPLGDEDRWDPNAAAAPSARFAVELDLDSGTVRPAHDAADPASVRDVEEGGTP